MDCVSPCVPPSGAKRLNLTMTIGIVRARLRAPPSSRTENPGNEPRVRTAEANVGVRLYQRWWGSWFIKRSSGRDFRRSSAYRRPRRADSVGRFRRGIHRRHTALLLSSIFVALPQLVLDILLRPPRHHSVDKRLARRIRFALEHRQIRAAHDLLRL